MLPENEYGVAKLLRELKPTIIGRPREGFACVCGDPMCREPSVAADISPPETSGMEVLWSTWVVDMTPHTEGGPRWTFPLYAFLDEAELAGKFRRLFGSQTYSAPKSA